MNTKKFNKKLVLNKETVVKLNNDDLSKIKGGEAGIHLTWTKKCKAKITCASYKCCFN